MSVLMRRLLVLVALAACKGQPSVGPLARPAQITTHPADGAPSCEDARAVGAADLADGVSLLRQALANKAKGDAVGARKLF
jgi:hypothetical protein